MTDNKKQMAKLKGHGLRMFFRDPEGDDPNKFCETWTTHEVAKGSGYDTRTIQQFCKDWRLSAIRGKRNEWLILEDAWLHAVLARAPWHSAYSAAKYLE